MFSVNAVWLYFGMSFIRYGRAQGGGIIEYTPCSHMCWTFTAGTSRLCNAIALILLVDQENLDSVSFFC